MKSLRFSFCFAIALINSSIVFALEEPSREAQPVTIAKPLLLNKKEKIPDGENLKNPRPPQKNADGSHLAAENEEDLCPRGAAINNLADVSVFSDIQAINKAKHSSGKYSWHTLSAWNYCHFHEGGRDWYGWRTGETFHWVLFRNNRFWWRDPYAGRWLYFYEGYWWWQGGKDFQKIQVFLEDGHYHICDANGILGEDLWTTGVKEEVTEPVKKKTPTPSLDKGRPGGHWGGRGGGLGMTGSEK